MNESFDLLTLSHLHSSSNYLMPRIGAKTNLKGFMFNLSFLIYKYAKEKDQDGNNNAEENKFAYYGR